MLSGLLFSDLVSIYFRFYFLVHRQFMLFVSYTVCDKELKIYYRQFGQ